RAALASVRRGRPGESGRGERLVVLGETADQLFGHLFGLSDVAESTPVEARDPAATCLDGVEEARLHYQQAAGLLDRLAQYAGVAATILAGLNTGAPIPS